MIETTRKDLIITLKTGLGDLKKYVRILELENSGS
jgi:hypothetical protein